MKNKILGIVVVVVMLLVTVGLVACELNTLTLAEYQATARVGLTDYANSRGQTNFTTENWTVIQGHVETGKAAIDAAETKPAVRTARDNAKAAVGAVPREVNVDNYIREKISDSWWDGRAEVSLTFPRVVEQGKSFEIIVITKNLLDEDLLIDPYSSSCSINLGVEITAIRHQTSDYEMPHWLFDGRNDDIAGARVILAGQQRENVWTFEEWILHGELFPYPPLGVFDIYLSNGEVFRNAITII